MNNRKSSRRIYIGSISTKRDKKELEELFEKIGPLEACVIYEDEAYMEYKSEDEARDAIEKYDGYSYLGQRLQVEWAHLEANKRRRSPLRDVQCYNCDGYGHFQRDCPEKSSYGRRDYRGGGRRMDRRDNYRRYDDRDNYRRDRRDRDFDRRDNYRRDRRDRDFDRRDRRDRDFDRRDRRDRRDNYRRDDDRDRRDNDRDRRDDDRDSRDNRRSTRNNKRDQEERDNVSKSSKRSVEKRKDSVEKQPEKREEITKNGDTKDHDEKKSQNQVEEKQDQPLY